VSVVLILILVVPLPILLIGLPLLFRLGSPVPDLVGFAMLAAVILFYIWSMDAWWIILPIVALVALVVRLDRQGQEARPDGETGPSARTRLLLRLWRTAHHVQQVLIVFILISFASGFGVAALGFVVSCMMIMLVASQLFRFSLARSARRDRNRPETGPQHASPAPFG
jgi:hypothetical protein